MRFIGDVHGKFQDLLSLTGRRSCIQVGDLGIGYRAQPYPVHFSSKFRFIRGNKDNPFICRSHPNYLGDYGYSEDLKIFYISGAWSINWRYLQSGYDYWVEEELVFDDLYKMIDLYDSCRPKIVVSHDCPDLIFNELFDRDLLPARTSSALGICWEKHQPDYWLFGHYHTRKEKKVGRTEFVCLGEMMYCDIPDLEWNIPYTPASYYLPIPEIKSTEMEYVSIKDQLSLPGI